MISRRKMLAGLASVAVVPAVAKTFLDAPAIAEIAKPLASGGIVKGKGDVYMNCLGRGELWFRATAEDTWQKIGAITDLEICPRTIQAGTFSDPNERDRIAGKLEIEFIDHKLLGKDCDLLIADEIAAHPPVIKIGGDHV